MTSGGAAAATLAGEGADLAACPWPRLFILKHLQSAGEAVRRVHGC